MSVFPNPSFDKVIIKGNHISLVEVVNNRGVAVKTYSLKDASNPTLKTSDLTSGIYNLRVQGLDSSVRIIHLVKM
jgi:hypothetical protein